LVLRAFSFFIRQLVKNKTSTLYSIRKELRPELIVILEALKKAFSYLILASIAISCNIDNQNREEEITEPLIDSEQIENDVDTQESEIESNYWDQLKTWTTDSYQSSKTWVTEKWPDSENWGEDAIDKIGKMATDLGDEMKNAEINVFSIDDDQRFGKELHDEIHTSTEYKVLKRQKNLNEYQRIEKIIQEIINSGEVEHADDLDWIVTIIDDQETVNAMCAPGGYIFVYTGLLNFAKNDSELAGVIAHEIAHADRRHGTRQLTAVYGVQLLISFLTDGDSELGAQIAAGLLNLKHSRDHEREADEYSVKYLCNSPYDADGVGQFFSNFEAQDDNMMESLISTHPDHEDVINC
jgi:hypothetical protein